MFIALGENSRAAFINEGKWKPLAFSDFQFLAGGEQSTGPTIPEAAFDLPFEAAALAGQVLRFARMPEDATYQPPLLASSQCFFVTPGTCRYMRFRISATSVPISCSPGTRTDVTPKARSASS